INRRNVRSTPNNPSGLRMYVDISQLIGAVIPKTKITAKPSPNAVFTDLETARNEHIPRKYDKIRFSMKADLINILMYSITLNFIICQLGDVDQFGISGSLDPDQS